jgi:RNA 2',3'-cyclic 3'-phosphodiesterase
MRLFVAVELSPPVREHLVKVQDLVRATAPNLSFTRPENLHLTLKFLGEVADADVTRITDALGSIAPVGEFDLRMAGIVCFPERGRVRVISADVELTANLVELQQRVEAAMEAVGFAHEQRAYHGHVTLARARAALPPVMRKRLTELPVPSEGAASMRVGQFVLMESRLHSRGPQYTPAARFYIKLPIQNNNI